MLCKNGRPRYETIPFYIPLLNIKIDIYLTRAAFFSLVLSPSLTYTLCDLMTGIVDGHCQVSVKKKQQKRASRKSGKTRYNIVHKSFSSEKGMATFFKYFFDLISFSGILVCRFFTRSCLWIWFLLFQLGGPTAKIMI